MPSASSAMLRGFPPRSSTTTLSDVRAPSSLAISRPDQPPPIITTSTLGRLFIVLFLKWVEFAARQYFAQAHRLGAEGFSKVLIDILGIAHARSRKPHQLPDDHIHVA